MSGHSLSGEEIVLRQEAEALRLSALSKSQLMAFRDMTRLIEAAADSSSTTTRRNSSRLAFLSGEKGTGKSSLFYTLRRCLEDETFIKLQKTSLSAEKFRIIEPVFDLLERVDNKHKIRWLEPLSLDPLPRGANLLAAVLSRIEDAISKVETGNRLRQGAIDPYGALDRARHQLTSLKTEAIQALEGNVGDHSSRMDPSSYSIAAAESERAKIGLSRRLDNVLDGILHGYSNDQSGAAEQEGIFIMMVDDLDLRPSKAVEVLKLAHSLSSRRLFYVFLGALRELDQVLYYSVQGEYKSLLNEGSRASEHLKIEASANETASSLIRKLIPLGQRVEIEDMSVEEALNYDWNSSADGGAGGKLIDLLMKAPPFINDLVGSGSLADLAKADEIVRIWKRQREPTEDDLKKKDDVRFQYHESLMEFSRNKLEAPEEMDGEEGGNEEPKQEFFGQMFQPTGWFNFIDLLMVSKTHSKSQKDEPLYDGANVLRSTPRHIGDLLHSLKMTQDSTDLINALKSGTEAKNLLPEEKGREDGTEGIARRRQEKRFNLAGMDKAKNELAHWVHETLKGHVNEDGGLTVPVQDRLKSSVEKHEIWELTPPDVRARIISGDKMNIVPFEWRNTIGMSPHDVEFVVSRVLRREVEAKRAGPGEESESDYVVLGERSRPAFKLLHDFFVFSGIGVITESIPVLNPEALACSRWSTGSRTHMSIPWATSRWQSFWKQDVFTDLWNLTFEKTRNVLRQRSRIGETELSAFLVLSWIANVLTTLDAQPSDPGMAEALEDKSTQTHGSRGIITDKLLVNSSENKDENDDGSKKGKAMVAKEAFWELAEEKVLDEFKMDLQHTIRAAFHRLKVRVGDGRIDGYTRGIQNKIIECLMLMMPEAGPLMFFMKPRDRGLHDKRSGEDQHSPSAMEHVFLEVLQTFAEQINWLNPIPTPTSAIGLRKATTDELEEHIGNPKISKKVRQEGEEEIEFINAEISEYKEREKIEQNIIDCGLEKAREEVERLKNAQGEDGVQEKIDRFEAQIAYLNIRGEKNKNSMWYKTDDQKGQEEKIYHDIMREVRRRRIQNIGDHIGDRLGFSLLIQRPSLIKVEGQAKGIDHWFKNVGPDDEFTLAFDEETFGPHQREVLADFLRAAVPGPRHLRSAFREAERRAQAAARGNEKTDWNTHDAEFIRAILAEERVEEKEYPKEREVSHTRPKSDA